MAHCVTQVTTRKKGYNQDFYFPPTKNKWLGRKLSLKLKTTIHFSDYEESNLLKKCFNKKKQIYKF